jgi:hypothetical protein
MPGVGQLARGLFVAGALLVLGGTTGLPSQAAPSKPGTDASGWPEITSEEKTLTKVAEDQRRTQSSFEERTAASPHRPTTSSTS